MIYRKESISIDNEKDNLTEKEISKKKLILSIEQIGKIERHSTLN